MDRLLRGARYADYPKSGRQDKSDSSYNLLGTAVLAGRHYAPVLSTIANIQPLRDRRVGGICEWG